MSNSYHKELAKIKLLLNCGFNHCFEMKLLSKLTPDNLSTIRYLRPDLKNLGMKITVSRKEKGLATITNVPQPARSFILKYFPGKLIHEQNI